MKRFLPVIAGVLASTYALLTILAMVCLFEHASPTMHARTHGHDQSTTSAHSSVCTWACQAGSYAALVSAPATVHPTLLSFPDITISLSSHARLLTGLIVGGSPPDISFTFHT